MDTLGKAKLAAQFFAERAVVAVAENETFKRLVNMCERFDQHVHALAAGDLASVDNEVAVAETALQREAARRRHGRMNFNLLRRKTITQQFLLHELRGDNDAVEFFV